jgi:undecaprenyl-diphosphatase
MTLSIMPLSQAILLAIIQGLTEFLPISSSGHLYAISWLLGWQDQGLAFDIALHLGTLAAVIIYFFRDWMQIIATGLGMNYAPDQNLARNSKLLWLLMAATVPVGLAGLAFKDAAETSLRTPWVIGGMLIGVGLLMYWGERTGHRTKDIAALSTADAMAIGVSQALAVVPGTSRSGITMTAGLFRDLDRPTAARFSFLLSTPAIGAAGAKALYDGLKEEGARSLFTTETMVGILVSGVVGWLVIRYLMRYLARNSFGIFIWYRIAFGILLIALAFFRTSRP